ncbi:MAG TPA: hypothetical protein VIA18_24645 [Polyangia bacterium]|nr:hypothetical protein [Polyangia bacterium]
MKLPHALVAATVACAMVVATPAAANPSHNASDALERGHNAYDRGDYGRAIDTLHPLLYPSIELGTEDDVVLAHRLLALSYFFVDKSKEAEQEVTSLLALRPNYALDPIVDPPVAVRFFDDVRQRQSERLRAIENREHEEAARARKEAERRQAVEHAKAERVYVDRVVERHSRFIALLPFGAGQIQNGQLTKGVLFATSETLLAATSLGTWGELTFSSRFPYDPSTGRREFSKSDATLAQTLTGLQLATGAAFYAVAIWGIIDAQVLFKREVVRGEREREQHRAPAKRSSLTVVPLKTPTMTGVGMQGSF